VGSITGHLGFGEVLRGHRHAARLTLASFAADVPEKLAAFMADSQVGFGVDATS
jgi:hypothetical protein